MNKNASDRNEPIIRTVAPSSSWGATYPPCLADRDIRAAVAHDRELHTIERMDGELNYAVTLYAYVSESQTDAPTYVKRVNQALDGIACSLRRAGVPTFVVDAKTVIDPDPPVRILATVAYSATPRPESLFVPAVQNACRKIANAVVTNDPDSFDMQPDQDYR